jgi:hypothetical protein
MKRRLLVTAAVLATGLFAACASAPTPVDYAAERPALDLQTYFSGNLQAHGLFTDRGGKVRRRFSVQMKCSWRGDEGVLDEDFTYSDGKKERRVWRLKKLPGGRYTGTTEDVVGIAQGQAAGNAFQWQYTLKLAVDGSVYEVQFDDWMYLVDERVMLNTAVMSKFGIRLGEVTLAFHKN